MPLLGVTIWNVFKQPSRPVRRPIPRFHFTGQAILLCRVSPGGHETGKRADGAKHQAGRTDRHLVDQQF